MYRFFIRPLLFLVDPEVIHHFTFNFIRFVCAIPGMRSLLSAMFSYRSQRLEKTLFGVKFPNPVGLAAGLDKDAQMVDELSSFGFGLSRLVLLHRSLNPATTSRDCSGCRPIGD